MTAKDFFDLVCAMREVQIAFLDKKIRTPELLADCKRLEHLVDAEIARVKKVMANQPTSFSKQ